MYSKNGIFELTWSYRNKMYIGHTGRSFRTRCNEHMHDIKVNKDKSEFAKCILNTGYAKFKCHKIIPKRKTNRHKG
jgi:hypothetical protein